MNDLLLCTPGRPVGDRCGDNYGWLWRCGGNNHHLITVTQSIRFLRFMVIADQFSRIVREWTRAERICIYVSELRRNLANSDLFWTWATFLEMFAYPWIVKPHIKEMISRQRIEFSSHFRPTLISSIRYGHPLGRDDRIKTIDHIIHN